MQFVHAIEAQKKISDENYDKPTECDMWINAELIHTIETTDTECFITTEDACYLVDKVAESIQDVLKIEF